MRRWMLTCCLCIALVPNGARVSLGQAKSHDLPAAQADDKARQLAEDEDQFRKTLKIENKVLLDFFRDLTITGADQARIGQLIKQLDSPAFKERDKATAALIAEGPRALPLLQQSLPGATLELR